jgi:hypothetical protein
MPNYTSPAGYSPYNEQLTSSISHPVGTWSYPITTQIDYQGGNVAIYVGYALPNNSNLPGSSSSGNLTSLSTLPVWAIQLITYNGSSQVISTQWSPLYAYFGDVWNNRISLIYS